MNPKKEEPKKEVKKEDDSKDDDFAASIAKDIDEAGKDKAQNLIETDKSEDKKDEKKVPESKTAVAEKDTKADK